MTTLQKIGMFKQLSNMELAKLLGKLEQQTAAIGTVLFRQGDPGDKLFLIKSGKLELFVEAPGGGSAQLISVLGEGDTLGEMAMLTREVRSATAVAATDAELYIIDRETFEQLLVEQPSISGYFIRLLSKRLTTTNEQLQANKEVNFQSMAAELEAFPLPLRQLLLWSSEFPRISLSLAESRFGVPLDQILQQGTPLGRYLTRLDDKPGWFTLMPDARRVIAEMATMQFGHEEKRCWTAEMLAYYETTHEWEAAIELLAHGERWAESLELLVRVIPTLDDEGKKQLFSLLSAFPPELVAGDFELLTGFFVYGGAMTRPEQGLVLLDRAWSDHAEDYSDQQWIATYKWAAELYAQLHKHQQAMEYLTLAEAKQSRSTFAWNGGSQEYDLAKQQLALRQSRRLADSAAGLFHRSRLGGWIAAILVVVSLWSFHVMEPFGGLSRAGMDFIGIGIAAVVLWIVNIIPDYLVGLGMVMAWVLGGLVSPEVALSGFASTTWLYMIFIMAFIAVITRSGILFRVSLNALKHFPRHYKGQLWGVVAGGFLLNPLIPSSSAKVSLGVPLARTLSESMGFANNSRGSAGLGLAAMIFYGFTAPFVLTGSYTNMMAYGLASLAEPVNWLQWFVYALPAFLIFAAVILIILHFMFRDVRQVRPISDEVLEEQLRLLGPWTRNERIAVSTTLSSIGLLILQPLHGIDSAWVMLLGFVVLIISGALDRQTISTGIDWTFLLFLGVAFSFASVADELGIAHALSSFLGAKLAGFLSSPALLLSIVILVSFLVTLVIRDDPAVILLVTALLPLAKQAGIHPWIFVFVILLATDPFFFTYQSPTYLTAYYSSEGKSFSHRQGQQIALAYAVALLLAVIVSVPYWQWIGLIQ
ncbi:SLC13 family permease [Brevibacillus ruminantium]|uniref:SLC13 family permease n=1 Tax=Brevibacillus ruminantium TaxID=2950604 RepID=A0ABY4WJ07_9BACL|nr:SLC13 family permease [Brevibacillus ruminantium]USG66864.1 SLC13 family permease [Brevibacillus ruminantium]